MCGGPSLEAEMSRNGERPRRCEFEALHIGGYDGDTLMRTEDLPLRTGEHRDRIRPRSHAQNFKLAVGRHIRTIKGSIHSSGNELHHGLLVGGNAGYDSAYAIRSSWNHRKVH